MHLVSTSTVLMEKSQFPVQSSPAWYWGLATASQRQSGGWRDLNGDGSIQSNEYQNLGDGESANWAWEIDSKGDVWMAPENGPIDVIAFKDWIAMGVRFIPAQLPISMPAEFAQIERIVFPRYGCHVHRRLYG